MVVEGLHTLGTLEQSIMMYFWMCEIISKYYESAKCGSAVVRYYFLPPLRRNASIWTQECVLKNKINVHWMSDCYTWLLYEVEISTYTILVHVMIFLEDFASCVLFI